jgi:putative PIN family toxin of toxin-antitoxin system
MLVNNKFRLVISADILLEYEEVIQQKYSVATANAFVSLLAELSNVDYVYPNFKWELISGDPDDNKYCDCAISGQADYIITEDRHFDILKSIQFPSLTVLGIDKFLELLQEND